MSTNYIETGMKIICLVTHKKNCFDTLSIALNFHWYKYGMDYNIQTLRYIRAQNTLTWSQATYRERSDNDS